MMIILVFTETMGLNVNDPGRGVGGGGVQRPLNVGMLHNSFQGERNAKSITRGREVE